MRLQKFRGTLKTGEVLNDLQIYVDKGTRDVWVIKGLKWIDGAENCALRYSADDFEEIEEYFEEFLEDTEKPKAYHVTDEYSYDCLMQELEEQGYLWIRTDKNPTSAGIPVSQPIIYLEENKKISWDYGESNIKEKYDIIEYHKEEPKFRARIREELNIPLTAKDYYFVKASKEIKTTKSAKNLNTREAMFIMTKTEWDKLGINDTNADFEEVEK